MQFLQTILQGFVGVDALLVLEFQLGVIKAYLPKMLSLEEVEAIVKNIIAEGGFSGMKDMGKVMGQATKAFAGKADNKTVSDIVKQQLAQ